MVVTNLWREYILHTIKYLVVQIYYSELYSAGIVHSHWLILYWCCRNVQQVSEYDDPDLALVMLSRLLHTSALER